APGGDYTWYDALTGGTVLFNGANFTTPILTNPTQVPTHQLYYVEVMDANGCISLPRAEVDVTIKSIPPAPTVTTPVRTCSSDPLLVSATSAAGDQIDWWTESVGGVIFNANSDNYTTSALTADTTFYISTIRSGCFSATRTVQDVKVINRSVVDPIADRTICTGESVAQAITVTPVAGTQISWSAVLISGSATGYTPADVAPTISDVLVNTSNLPAVVEYTVTTYTMTTPFCQGNTITFRVTVNPKFEAAVAGDVVICEGNSTTLAATSLNAPSPVFNWYDASTGGTLIYTGASYTVNPTALTTYYVDVTADGCTGSRKDHSVNITLLPFVNAATDTFFCETGALVKQLTGGPAGAVNYAWTSTLFSGTATGFTNNPSSTTGLINDVITNTGTTVAQVLYTVNTVTKAAPGCPSPVKLFLVTINPGFEITPTLTQVKCFGLATGAITVDASLAAQPVTFDWSGVSAADKNSPAVDSLASGTYSVAVTDAGGCTLFRTYNITQPANEIIIAGTVMDVKCFNDPTGRILTSVANTVGTVNYSWSNGATTSNLTNVRAGVYTVDLTDGNGCKKSNTFTIAQPDEAITTTPSIVDVTCFGKASGEINPAVTGGTEPYTYDWGGGVVIPNVKFLEAGPYTLTVIDDNGCLYDTTFIVKQPAQLVVNRVVTDVACNGGSSGAIDITPQGGVAPYTFVWEDAGTNEDRTGLAKGSYTVIVTDKNGCSTTATIVVNQSTPLNAVLTPKVFAGGNHVSCAGMTDGEIALTPSGGVSPYTYQWSTGATTKDIKNLGANTYSVDIIDFKGCISTFSTTLKEPAGMVNTLTAATYVGGYNITCNGLTDGAINFTVSGGSMPYKYTVNNVAVNAFPHTGIAAGNYVVKATDANGCISQQSITLTQPPVLSVTSTAKVYPGGKNVSCFGEDDGEVGLVASGGTPAYSYLWSSGQTTPLLTGLKAGSYSTRITDANGCVTNVITTLTEPNALTLDLQLSNYNGVNISCSGLANGSISSTVTGGTSPYTYNWSNSTNGTGLSNIGAGTYTVLVTDNNGCSINKTAVMTQPAVMATTFTTSNYNGYEVSCFGGSNGNIQSNTTGGTQPYSIAWSTGESGTALVGKPAGSYTVVYTDVNNCKRTASITLDAPTDIVVNPIVSNFNGSNVSCKGSTNGSILIAQTGGLAPFSYTWDGGLPPTQSQSNLGAGTYSAVVKDANGCTKPVTVSLTAPSEMIVNTLMVADIKCFGGRTGSYNATVTGGTAPYSYNWKDASGTTVSNSFQPVGLSAGTYTVTVTDANGCKQSVGSNTLTTPPQLTATLFPVNVTCNGDITGSVRVAASGGVPGYSYQWGSGGPAADTYPSVGAGLYQVRIRDANNCILDTTQRITEPARLVISTTSSNLVSCNGIANGFIQASVTGGTGNYKLKWNTGSTSSQISNLKPGSYTLTVTDDSLCTMSRTFQVVLVNTPDPAFSYTDPACGSDTVNLVVKQVVPGSGIAILNGNATVSSTDGKNFLLTAGQFGKVVVERSASLQGCRASQVDTIVFREIPDANYESSYIGTLNVINNKMQLINTSKPVSYGNVSYEWFLDTALVNTAQSFELVFPDTIDDSYDVCLKATTTEGCTYNYCQIYNVGGKALIYVPNSFTPDGDGLNDTYSIPHQGLNLANFSFTVYDRGGQVIYHTKDPDFQWDGMVKTQSVSTGVYIFELTYTSDFEEGIQKKSGTIFMFR
ncbi:MAG: gliding motility-associated C-terminal domain-containing protein, partial [Bacteroidota bacterium]